MPTITFASPKGGAGKTTSAMLLATELAHAGLTVSLIDADPNHPICNWEEGGGSTDKLTIIRNDGEDKILDTIDEATKASQIVIVDLEGTANMAVSTAIAVSDLVIIPSQASMLDQKEAGKAIALVRRQEKIAQRQNPGAIIPARILLTKTSSAIRTKAQKRMVENLTTHGIERFRVELIDRAAFKAIFEFSATLRQLSKKDVSGLETAINNAHDFAAEVSQLLSSLSNQTKDERAVA